MAYVKVASADGLQTGQGTVMNAGDQRVPSSTWVVPAMPSTTRAPIEAALCQTARSRTMS